LANLRHARDTHRPLGLMERRQLSYRIIAASFQAPLGASFVVNGASPARDSELTSTSAEPTWRNGWSTAVTCEGEFSNTTRSYAGKVNVRDTWWAAASLVLMRCGRSRSGIDDIRGPQNKRWAKPAGLARSSAISEGTPLGASQPARQRKQPACAKPLKFLSNVAV
jgi:hypothetical protein